MSTAMSYAIADRASSRAPYAAEFRATLALAWPLVLTNLAQIALTTTDVIVLGRLGAPALAAGALGANLYFALLIFAIGLVSAIAPMMAERIGRKLHVVRDIRRSFRQGLWSAVLIALPAWAVLWHGEALLRLMGQEAQLAADAQAFMRGLQWGFLPFLGFIALRSFVSALEKPLAALVITALAILFNIVANTVLVFGHLGFPALGLFGSGLATSLSNTFLFVGLALVAAYGRDFRRYRVFGRWWRPDLPRLARLWKLGLPIGAAMAFEITAFNAAVFIMGLFGAASVAAHAIAIQIASASFMVPMGLGQAATVRVGRAFGARDSGTATRAGWTACMLAIGFMATMSLVLLAAPHVLIAIFIDVADPVNTAVVDLAVAFLFWAAMFQIADGAQVVGAGMLRGLQDTRVPMVYAALGYWAFGMPVGLLLAFKAGLQGTGIWIGLTAGLVVVAVMMIARWMRRERLGLVV